MIKNKGFTILEIIVVIVVLAVLALFASPMLLTSAKQRQEATVRANVSIAVSTITSRYALKMKKTASQIATISALALNQTTKNPIVKKTPGFTINSPAKGAVDFVPDDEKNLITINGYAEDTTTPLITKVVNVPTYN